MTAGLGRADQDEGQLSADKGGPGGKQGYLRRADGVLSGDSHVSAPYYIQYTRRTLSTADSALPDSCTCFWLMFYFIASLTLRVQFVSVRLVFR